jgi:type III pantothenate kinase
MNLAIDIGNTSIKTGLFEKDLLVAHHVFDTEVGFLTYLTTLKPNKTIVCSVGEIKVLEKISKNFPETLVLKTIKQVPLKIDYQTPNTLGLDRVVACLGARTLTKNNTLVVDIGTCITLDLIDKSGMFRGGNISPGPKLRFQAMHNFTAALPLEELKKEVSVVGRSTAEALQNGVYNGILYEIEGTYQQLSQKYPDLQLVLTGGYTSYFDNRLKQGIFAEPNLVLIGLNSILTQHV